MTLEIPAFVYAAICAAVIVFQFCLIAGAPWGPLTQGGKNPGALPASGRIAAALSVVLLAMMAAAMLSAAGLWPRWPLWTAWTTLGIQVLSTLMNWITPSRPERLLWGPVTTLMLIAAATIMLQ